MEEGSGNEAYANGNTVERGGRPQTEPLRGEGNDEAAGRAEASMLLIIKLKYHNLS